MRGVYNCCKADTELDSDAELSDAEETKYYYYYYYYSCYYYYYYCRPLLMRDCALLFLGIVELFR